MTVTTTATVREIVTDALLEIQAGTIGQAAEAEDADLARRHLDRMLKAWQQRGYPMFTRAGYSLTLTTAASYTLSPVRPYRIHNARLKRSGVEIPMWEMSRREYDELPDKTSTGLPTQFHYDRQREAALFYVWPVLSAANGETVEITYEREIEDVASLNDTVDVPGEWYRAVVLNLAESLSRPYGAGDQILTVTARDALKVALGSDAGESVTFEPAYG